MQTHQGSCHCGKVTFEFKGDLKEVVSCNCSICQRKGTLLTFIPDADFTLKSGADYLTDYQFGKKRIHHTFCKVCGVQSFASAQMPNGAKMKAVNARCIDNVDLKKFTIKEYDGKSL
jgi:hypothetical protein